MSFPPGTEMFQFPGFASNPYVFRVRYLHLISEIRTRRIGTNPDAFHRSRDVGLGIPISKVGFPIRKSTDQSSFAAPRSLSQRTTSFIASQRQGIHRMPLRHLIALIINARRKPCGGTDGNTTARQQRRCKFNQSS
jgi:hypothetical protein